MSIQSEIHTLQQSIAEMEQALKVASIAAAENTFIPQGNKAIDFVKQQLAQVKPAQHAAKLGEIEAGLDNARAELTAKQKKLIEQQKFVEESRRAIALKAKRVNELSAQMEVAIGELKAEINDANAVWRDFYDTSSALSVAVGVAVAIVPLIEEGQGQFIASAKKIGLA